MLTRRRVDVPDVLRGFLSLEPFLSKAAELAPSGPGEAGLQPEWIQKQSEYWIVIGLSTDYIRSSMLTPFKTPLRLLTTRMDFLRIMFPAECDRTALSNRDHSGTVGSAFINIHITLSIRERKQRTRQLHREESRGCIDRVCFHGLVNSVGVGKHLASFNDFPLISPDIH